MESSYQIITYIDLKKIPNIKLGIYLIKSNKSNKSKKV